MTRLNQHKMTDAFPSIIYLSVNPSTRQKGQSVRPSSLWSSAKRSLNRPRRTKKKIVQGENCWADTGRVKESMKGNPGPRDRRNDERNISRHLTSGASPGPRFSVSDWLFEKEAFWLANVLKGRQEGLWLAVKSRVNESFYRPSLSLSPFPGVT